MSHDIEVDIELPEGWEALSCSDHEILVDCGSELALPAAPASDSTRPSSSDGVHGEPTPPLLSTDSPPGSPSMTSAGIRDIKDAALHVASVIATTRAQLKDDFKHKSAVAGFDHSSALLQQRPAAHGQPRWGHSGAARTSPPSACRGRPASPAAAASRGPPPSTASFAVFLAARKGQGGSGEGANSGSPKALRSSTGSLLSVAGSPIRHRCEQRGARAGM
jgi:hypothetical protein